jgi:hypothetical protein
MCKEDLPVISRGEVSHRSALVTKLSHCSHSGFGGHRAGIEDVREISTGDLFNTSELFTKRKFVVEGCLSSGCFDYLFFMSVPGPLTEAEYQYLIVRSRARSKDSIAALFRQLILRLATAAFNGYIE